MPVKIVSHPPHLGTSEYTLEEDGLVHFQLLVDAAESVTEDLEVELWFADQGAGQTWTAKQCWPASSEDGISETSTTQERLHASIKAEVNSVLEFTIRHRESRQEEWTWISKPGKHGRVLVLPDAEARQADRDTSFESLFSAYDGGLKVEASQTSVSHTQLYLVSHEAPRQAPEYATVSWGRPKDLFHWVSLERLMSFWMEPNQGRETLKTPRDSYLIAFQRRDGMHVVLLPLSGLKNDCQSHFKTDESTGDLTMYTKNDGDDESSGQVIVGTGSALDDALDAVFAYTRQLFQRDLLMAREDCREKEIDSKWFEEFADGLFYCSWNAMYTDVSEQKLLDVMEGLDRMDVKVSGIIIDDGWQDIDEQRRWKSFVPPKSKFPDGLGGFVRKVKERYPYIKHVGVWHAISGYWNGFAPNSWISEKYRLVHVPMHKITVPEGFDDVHFVQPQDIRRLYDDFYKYLAGEGITMVKCDVQAFVDDISHSEPQARRMWRDYQDALKTAGQKYFALRVIYCMSHVANIFLSSLLQKNVPPACLRNSNDFFPDQDESHAWHIFWNATNAMYTSRLNCLPDWDMFDTTHPQARFHAISRSLSGGPILITDKKDATDRDLVNCMSSRPIGSSNETKVLRFAKPGQSRHPYVNFQAGRCTMVTNHTYDLLTLGVFNTTEDRVTECVSLNDFKVGPFKAEDGSYVVTRFSDAKTVHASVAKRNLPLFMVALENLDAEIFTAAPLLTLSSTRQCAVLGLLDKFAGAVGIAWYRVVTHSDVHQVLDIQVSHLGHLGIYITGFHVNIEKLLVTMRDVVIPASSVQSRNDGSLLDIDLLSAWDAIGGGGDGWWSNEVNVRIYFRT